MRHNGEALRQAKSCLRAVFTVMAKRPCGDIVAGHSAPPHGIRVACYGAAQGDGELLRGRHGFDSLGHFAILMLIGAQAA
jgi:hypothetical protein